MQRREFLTLLGGAAAAWPVAARAQQPAMPVIAFLSSRSADSDMEMLVAFRRGLNELGYAEGRNLAIEYRFADGQYDRLPALFTDLLARRVALIVYAGAVTTEPMLGIMRASQMPIVFNVGADPVRLGLAASINRPGGNMTGITTLANLLTGKRVGLLHVLVPNAKTIALLSTPSPDSVEPRDAAEATATLGLQLRVLESVTDREIEAAFATLDRQPVDAIVVATSPFFVTRANQIASLMRRHRLPAIYPRREFAEAGGLMSYGYDVTDGYRQMGIYAGRILKGDKPADLPVFQPTKFQFVINLKTARALDLDIPAKLLALSDEVIE
jgi:putative ABC transport system substrate-binding protein